MIGADYATVKEFAEASFTEKKSEFIGYISPVSAVDEAEAFISSIKVRHRKATHNVYAYILRSGSVTRFSDDGEPQGTAGIPVLDVLRKEGLTDVCCVVTRYFGGILLGGGGLVRAYSHSAKLAVEAAERMIMCACRRLEVQTDYNLYGKLAHALPEFNVKLLDTVFTDNVKLIFLCRLNELDDLEKKIADLTNGSATILKSDEIFGNFA